jgi:acyl-CoA thioester hydrolase
MAPVDPGDEQSNFLDKLVARRPVIVHRRILWGDCDPAGVVYTPRFGDYFTSARDWFLRAGINVHEDGRPEIGGIGFPMRALAYDFQASLTADDVIEMTVLVTAISRRTFTIKVAATNLPAKKPAFFATGTQVCFDRTKRAAILIPDKIAVALADYQNAQG